MPSLETGRLEMWSLLMIKNKNKTKTKKMNKRARIKINKMIKRMFVVG